MKKINRMALLKEVCGICGVKFKVNENCSVHVCNLDTDTGKIKPISATYPTESHALLDLVYFQFQLGEFELGVNKMEYLEHIWKAEFENRYDGQ